MNPATIEFGGQQLLLDPSGAVYWPARRSLIVADLHLEKSSSYAARGALLPPYDSRTTLDLLLRLVRQYEPERIIALGDSFHDGDGAARLRAADRAVLDHIAADAGFVWITGNHDADIAAGLPGVIAGGFDEDGCAFRHIAAGRIEAHIQGEFSGHYHPKARIGTRGRVIARPCFVVDERRLMLPALGAYAGGLDVTAAPIRTLFPSGAKLFLLGTNRLFGFLLSNDSIATA